MYDRKNFISTERSSEFIIVNYPLLMEFQGQANGFIQILDNNKSIQVHTVLAGKV